MKNNPFSLMFGKEPLERIERYTQQNEVLGAFTEEHPQQLLYMIAGVRGSGKTVFMTTIAKKLQAEKDWIVIELNSSGELLKDLAGKLYAVKGFAAAYKAEGINLSAFGFGVGVNVKETGPVVDPETMIERMLNKLAEKGKRILITIDEVSNTTEMRRFAGAYQLFVRHDLPLFLLMTGLYENINALQNVDNLTFLYRAPKIYLKALNISSIASFYERIFQISREDARNMAKMTLGYPFAFQVLGYFTFENKDDPVRAIAQCRQYIDEYVYDKIWSELSEKETVILGVIAEEKCYYVKDLKEKLEMKANMFSVYRDRLLRKGILNGEVRGKLEFALPFFDEYVLEHI